MLLMELIYSQYIKKKLLFNYQLLKMFKHLERHHHKHQILFSPKPSQEKINFQSPIIHKHTDTNLTTKLPRSKSKRLWKNGLLSKYLPNQQKDETRSHYHPLKNDNYYLKKSIGKGKLKPQTESTYSHEKPSRENNPEREAKTETGKGQTITGPNLRKECRLIARIKEIKKLNRVKKRQFQEYQVKVTSVSQKHDNKEETWVEKEKEEYELQESGKNHLLFGKEISELDSYECNSNGSRSSVQNFNLGLESKIKETRDKLKLSAFVPKISKYSIKQLISNHLKIIDQIYAYLQESRDFHDDIEEWQNLHFLLLKKYYLERLKVLHYLKKFPMKTPFIIKNHQISYKGIIDFMKTQECMKMICNIEENNSQIKKQLKDAYEQFERQKVGEQIHLFQYDNFSETVIQELWVEFILTEYNSEYNKEIIMYRLCRTLQIIFLIYEFNSRRLITFEDGAKALQSGNCWEYIKQGKDTLEKELQCK